MQFLLINITSLRIAKTYKLVKVVMVSDKPQKHDAFYKF